MIVLGALCTPRAIHVCNRRAWVARASCTQQKLHQLLTCFSHAAGVRPHSLPVEPTILSRQSWPAGILAEHLGTCTKHYDSSSSVKPCIGVSAAQRWKPYGMLQARKHNPASARVAALIGPAVGLSNIRLSCSSMHVCQKSTCKLLYGNRGHVCPASFTAVTRTNQNPTHRCSGALACWMQVLTFPPRSQASSYQLDACLPFMAMALS